MSYSPLSCLPESFGSLSKLVTLSITSGSLQWVPDSIVNLTSLEKFYISHNSLLELPNSIVSLTRLSYLYLYGNKLTALPDNIGSLANSLTYISTSYNHLTTLPASYGSLTQLSNVVALAEIGNLVRCMPETLDFTHNGKDLCRVGEVAAFQFAVTNLTDKRFTVEFKPRPSHKWEMTFDSPMLTLEPNAENAVVTCNLKLLCTTTMSGVGVPMVVYGNEIGQLWVSAEGALSAMLDRDEITLERSLGSGSYATVHVGKWRGTPVAVKVFREHLFDIKELAADVRREVDLCMNLRHPNVIQYFGAAISKTSAVIVMELATNGSLGDAIKEHKLTVAAKFRMAHDVASGMLFLHTSHVIHRDLKPDNVLLMSLDSNAPVCCKLSDFGTSRAIGSADSARTYTKGVGTPSFCAPEVLDGQKYSSAADVYSFSMLLWNLFSEIVPYSDVESNFAMVKMISEGKRPQMAASIPEEIRPLLEATWTQSAEERAKFDTIVGELERIMAANGTLPAHMAAQLSSRS